MTFKTQPGEKYTIRRQVLKLFGAGFHIYDDQARVIGYCKQKAFKLREDLRLFTSEACTEELLRISTPHIIDFGATYTVSLPTGEPIGHFVRKGMKSSFVRDEWLVLSPESRELATIQEDSTLLGMLRRYIEYVSVFFPEKFHMTSQGGTPVATFRQHFNPFIYRLGITVAEHVEDGGGSDGSGGPGAVAETGELDDLMILAAGVLLASIEGRE